MRGLSIGATWTLFAVCALSTACGAEDAPTFNRDVAPIVFAKCASCHRPGEVAPFSLLTYGDVKRRARQIVEVTRSRFMPPWLPEPGYGDFVGQERRLDDAELSTLARWVAGGSVEGAPEDLPPPPVFPEGWQFGEPDLVLQLDAPYTLPAEGLDVIRNFVIRTPVREPRWVKSVEIRPGNKRIVHHAVLKMDRTAYSRRLDALDPEPGFPGMTMGNAESPDGHLIVWTPGSRPYTGPADLAWRLEPGADLVFQLHMLPSGKPETIQPRIGLVFTDRPPERESFSVMLRDDHIDIPAGVSDYEIQDSFDLGVDVTALAIYPHAHYLGDLMEAWAVLPDGSRTELLRIPHWDFNWQGMYRYREPVDLPAGTTLHMRFTYDNSADNPLNPNVPPRRVVSGNRSSDEMGNLALQVVPRRNEDLTILREEQWRKMIRESPDDPAGYYNLAIEMARRGRPAAAIQQYQHVVRLDPSDEVAHYALGSLFLKQNDPQRAAEHFTEVVRIDPANAEAWLVLGWIRQRQDALPAAIEAFRHALDVDPGLTKAHYYLGLALVRGNATDEAARHFDEALRLSPDFSPAKEALDKLRGGSR